MNPNEHEEAGQLRPGEAFGMVTKAEAEKMAKEAVVAFARDVLAIAAGIDTAFYEKEFARRVMTYCHKQLAGPR